MAVRKSDLTKLGRESWVADSLIKECQGCKREFGLLARKHHCRACGQIFCGDCSKWEIEFTAASRRDEEGYKEKKKRVCEPCFSKISEAQARAAEAKMKASSAAEAVNQLRDKIGSFRVGEELTDEERALREELDRRENEADMLDNENCRANSSLQLAQGQEEDDELAGPYKDDTGAYLVFSATRNGAMLMVWSHQKVEGALAYGRPMVKVPEFKFARDGKWELHRNINGNKNSYYLSWGMFVKRCQKFECRITDFGEGSLFPLSLVLHYDEGLKLRRVQPNESVSLEGVDAVAAIHKDVNTLDLDSMLKERFMALANEAGAAVNID